MSTFERYRLAERLETLADQIESDPEWFADPDLDDGDLIDLLKEASDVLREKE